MIDRTNFAAGFTLLLDRFGRQMGKPTIAEYQRILDPELSTDEFERATREIFREDTFFPSPQRFIDAARGSVKEHAEGAWQQMLEAAKRGHYPELETLPAATRAALKVVPLREIMYADSDIKLARLKREFVDAHSHAVEPALVKQ